MKHARKKAAVKVSARRVRLAPPRHWKVGDVAKLRFGLSLMRALVIEDRGVFGGSQIVRVEVKSSWPGFEPEQFEIGASYLIPLKSPRRRSA